MHVKLQDLIRFYQNAQHLKLPDGVEDSCQSLCCANPGQNPADFDSVAAFVEVHGNDEASPFFAMPVDELVGHSTVCGTSSRAFTQEFVSLIKNQGATTVIFFASFSGRDIVDEEADTVDLNISAGGYDADGNAPLADNWRDGLSPATVGIIEAAGAKTLMDALEVFPGDWSWRPETDNGWICCESE